ncbi:unnamed protein product [Caenorhabditis sp. 36 PRJEB53466]|nr:unnamed protein product [Caenorhabditis sp. 36 PRJEB53466]
MATTARGMTVDNVGVVVFDNDKVIADVPVGDDLLGRGSAAQTKAMKQVAGSIKLELAQYVVKLGRIK